MSRVGEIPAFDEIIDVAQSRGADSEAPDLWTGAAGLWPFAAGGGLTAFDVSGYGNHGTLTNMDPATDWVPTEIGPALALDGADDIIKTTTQPPSCLSAITIAWWGNIEPTGVGDAYGRICDWYPAPSLYRRAGSNTNTLYWYGRIGGVAREFRISTSIITGSWKHIAVTFDGLAIRVYIDGVLDNTDATYAGALTAPTNQFCIGGRSTGTDRCLAATLNNFGILSRALAPSEIQQEAFDSWAKYRLRSKVFPTAVAPSGIVVPWHLLVQGAA